MARTIISSDPERRAAYEPLYDRDQHTGVTIEVFHADSVLAASFGRRAGWFSWTCQPGCLPECPPAGPFASGYTAYRDAIKDHLQLFVK
jgi:hypothetical protein